MIARQLLRRPGRAAATCLGIALAVAIMILGRFMLDGLNYVMESEFNVAQRQDVMITFSEPTPGRVVHDAKHLPGVLAAEPFRAVPVRLRSSSHSRRIGIMGLPERCRLYRVADVRRNVQMLPKTGLILSERLAQVLDVRPGERLQVEVLEGRRPVADLRIAGVVQDFQGEAAYASLDEVHRLMQEADAVTGLFLSADSLQGTALYHELKHTPRVVGVSLKGAALTSLKETIVANILRMRAFNIGFACVIACGVVYNSARITLAERSRELATLRVVGFTRGEITRILLGELALLTFLAIPLGVGIGHVLADFVIRIAYNTELFRIPLVISRHTDAFAALVTLLAAAGTGLLATMRLARLDLVAVLKTWESCMTPGKPLQRLSVAAVIIAVIAALIYGFLPAAVDVDLTTVSHGPLTVTVNEDGKTRVRERYIVATPFSGWLLRHALHCGDSVVVGETIIAVIEASDVNLLDDRAPAESEARLNAAEAHREQAATLIAKAQDALTVAKKRNEPRRSLSGKGNRDGRVV